MNIKKPFFKPVFIGEPITAGFDKPAPFIKKPFCPDSILWRGKALAIIELVSEWHDLARKERYSRNMSDAHLELASAKGSLGVGRFYFRVRTADRRIFDIYYDRAVRNVFDAGGCWVLFQELIPIDTKELR